MDLAFNLTIVGITVVFLALIVLSFIIFLLGRFSSLGTKITGKSSNAAANEASLLEIDEEDNKIDSSNNDNLQNEELMAVLTAAVQYAMSYKPDCKIRVKSFKRIPQSSPVWNTVSRSEHISNKL